MPSGLPSSQTQAMLQACAVARDVFCSPVLSLRAHGRGRRGNLWFQGSKVLGPQPPQPCTSCMLSVFSASLSQRCSSGFSLHMFLKLSWSASKRQMVVWLNIFPVRARQAGHYTPGSFPRPQLPRVTPPSLPCVPGRPGKAFSLFLKQGFKALKRISINNCSHFKPVPVSSNLPAQIGRHPLQEQPRPRMPHLRIVKEQKSLAQMSPNPSRASPHRLWGTQAPSP